jgi:hypothetical protein
MPWTEDGTSEDHAETLIDCLIIKRTECLIASQSEILPKSCAAGHYIAVEALRVAALPCNPAALQVSLWRIAVQD